MLLPLLLSCSGFRAAPHPEAAMTEAALAAQRFGADGDVGVPPYSGDVGFPRFPRLAAPPGAALAVPGEVLDVEVTPDGQAAWILARIRGTSRLYRWGWGQDVAEVVQPAPASEIAVSPFDGALYAIVKGAEHELQRWEHAGGGWQPTTLYRAPVPLASPTPGLARWDGYERVFVARGAGEDVQVIGVRSDGTMPYEVTQRAGEMTDLTDAELRSRPSEGYTLPPAVLAAAAATPEGIDPTSGALLWRDGAGGQHRRAYVQHWEAGANWGADEELPIQAEDLRISPNGWLHAAWSKGAPLALHDPAGQPVGQLEARFLRPPAWTPDGRALVGPTADGVIVVAVDHPMAPVRHWERVPDATPWAQFAAAGFELRATDADAMHQLYEGWSYEGSDYQRGRPVLATVDGMLEVLHAGFEAVFLEVEREVSAPALAELADALQAAGARGRLPRIAAVGAVTSQLLEGEAVHPDAEAAVARRGGSSALHPGKDIDWGDFLPRGPYAHDPALQQYFRAFKYMNLLDLSAEERAALAADPRVLAAWERWTGAQERFLAGSRGPGAFDPGWQPLPYVRPQCVPEDSKKPRMFALNWGLDSEIIERSVAHDRLPPECGVARRVLPSGLDVLAGLGSPIARDLLEPIYADHAALEAVHQDLAATWGQPLSLPGVVPSWWRILQLLGSETAVPEGVDPALWRARLAETALASWASLRHTMVLVNEITMAEMGAGGPEGFELLTLEPTRHVVDPLPAAWDQIAATLGLLAQEAGAESRVAELLTEAAGVSTKLAGLARRQMAGEPLTEEEYLFIVQFGRAVEHPYLLLKTAAAGRDDLALPEPIPKIVDVHVWKEPRSPPVYWHAAVGHPRELRALIGDRGALIPGSGAVYSYYEVEAPDRLDDARWREQVGAASPPYWSAAEKALVK